MAVMAIEFVVLGPSQSDRVLKGIQSADKVTWSASGPFSGGLCWRVVLRQVQSWVLMIAFNTYILH